METHDTQAPPPAGPVDYDAIYQGSSPFRDLVGPRAPWDIGEPQPAVVAVEQAGKLGHDVLDAGCGLGQNAVHLAARGHRVTGFDLSPVAIERASEHAAQASVDVDFLVADVTALPDFGRSFDTVLDSALFHCLDAPARRAYAATVHGLIAPGGSLVLLCFSDRQEPLSAAVHHIAESELRELFAGDWRIASLTGTTIATSLDRDAVERAAQAIGRPVEDVLASFTTDDRGRFCTAAWELVAHRL